MFFSLDRIEDENIAVLISDDGKKTDIPYSDLPSGSHVGDVFRFEGGAFIYDADETKERKQRIAEKRNRLFNKLKKQ